MLAQYAWVSWPSYSHSGSAAGADLSPRYQPVARGPVYAAVYNWTGFYLGINGGGGWGRSQWDGVDGFDVSGGLIGGTIGYNWQVGQLVIGAEGDIDWSGMGGTSTVLCPPGCTTRNDWLATVRGRVGYAFDRFLPYLTGGLASATSMPAFRDFPAAASAMPAGPSAPVLNSVLSAMSASRLNISLSISPTTIADSTVVCWRMATCLSMPMSSVPA